MTSTYRYIAEDSAGRPTVVLADDHVRVLARVRQILSPSYEVIAMVEDGWKAVQVVAKFHPDVAVLDILMPRLDGLEAAREIREMRCQTSIVFLTVQEDEDYITAALAAGAKGYVVKSRLQFDLVKAIEDALLGRIFVSSRHPPSTR